MLFNSWAFAVFLPIVFLLYWILPHRYRWILLLISSYYFYMSWNVKYVVLIFLTTFISYVCALILEKTKKTYQRKCCLAAVFVVSLGVLFFFKYYNFLLESIADVMGLFAIQLHPVTLNLLLPVGISFYTFQTLSYVIDVYRGTSKAEHHFGKYAAFISFFPQLVAGPIERTNHLLPQISEEHTFDYKDATYGLKLMAWGFFKKIVIADTMVIYVDKVYSSVNGYSGFALVVAAIFFAFQIYCDFSGYSDIAIGTAKLFGIQLMKNFTSPYLARSIKEFWSRWHISLSTWFRDYLYIPLGGNRCSKVRSSCNLLITFMVSGLWHGANVTFLIWGAIHGIGQVLENIFRRKKKQKGILSIIGVFAFWTISLVFFRADCAQDAFYVFQNAFAGIGNLPVYLKGGLDLLGISGMDLFRMGMFLMVLMIYDFISLKKDVIHQISSLHITLRWMIYVGIILTIVFYTPVQSGSEFIYFQF